VSQSVSQSVKPSVVVVVLLAMLHRGAMRVLGSLTSLDHVCMCSSAVRQWQWRRGVSSEPGRVRERVRERRSEGKGKEKGSSATTCIEDRVFKHMKNQCFVEGGSKVVSE
jgi:hypothetical protein